MQKLIRLLGSGLGVLALVAGCSSDSGSGRTADDAGATAGGAGNQPPDDGGNNPDPTPGDKDAETPVDMKPDAATPKPDGGVPADEPDASGPPAPTPDGGEGGEGGSGGSGGEGGAANGGAANGGAANGGTANGGAANGGAGGSGGSATGGAANGGAANGGSGGSGGAGGAANGGSGGGVTEVAVPAGDMETVLMVNELYFELPDMIGQKIWVHGFYGNQGYTGDGIGFLVTNPQVLMVDEAFPHHTMARVSGNLPAASEDHAEFVMYGEIQDFAVASGKPTFQPTPLVVVEKFIQLSSPVAPDSWEPLDAPADAELLDPASLHEVEAQGSAAGPAELDEGPPPPPPSLLQPLGAPTGTQAALGDRSVILSGGVDASGNHARYKDNVTAKVKRMRDFGFTDDQIRVFYNDGSAIDVDGMNVVDSATDKAMIGSHFTQLATDMQGSSTLTVFVTDHGTGHNPAEAYKGARPAFSGEDATGGAQHAENTFFMDATAKVYRETDEFITNGHTFRYFRPSSGPDRLQRRVDGKWVNSGTDADNSGFITEGEVGRDLNGDGDATDLVGFNVAELEADLNALVHKDNSWDTDRDGTSDVRLRWDGVRYVAERFDMGMWKEMGRDTNGDFKIDAADGGVDWNLDGDKLDTVGFHEGINLWGRNVLWDDEFAAMIKPLSDKGVHVVMEMVSCYSGGMIPQLENIVENVVAGSSETTPHYNRRDAMEKVYAADEIAFLQNLQGIDSASWTSAWTAAIAADNLAAGGNHPNEHTRWETPMIASQTIFQEVAPGEYNIELDIPATHTGMIYDFEIIFGLQTPRWTGGAPQDLPAGLTMEEIPGGFRIFSAVPITDGQKVKILGTPGNTALRIGLTNIFHVSVGYTMAAPGNVSIPPPQPQAHASEFTINFRHAGMVSYVEGRIRVLNQNLMPLANVSVSVGMSPTGFGPNPQTYSTDSNGYIDYSFQIYQYDTYTVSLISIVGSNVIYDSGSNVASSRMVVVVP